MPTSIRLASTHDAEAILAIYAPFCAKDSPVSFELEPPSVEEMKARIEKVVERRPWLVCERDGSILGYAYASTYRERAAYRWSVEVGLYVGEGSRRSGVGRGLYEALFGVLAAQNYVSAYAGVTLPNPASVGLHEAVGFEPVGVYKRAGFKAGAWWDVGWYQLSLRPAPSHPDEPIDIASVVDRDAWRQAIASGLRLLL